MISYRRIVVKILDLFMSLCYNMSNWVESPISAQFARITFSLNKYCL